MICLILFSCPNYFYMLNNFIIFNFISILSIWINGYSFLYKNSYKFYNYVKTNNYSQCLCSNICNNKECKYMRLKNKCKTKQYLLLNLNKGQFQQIQITKLLIFTYFTIFLIAVVLKISRWITFSHLECVKSDSRFVGVWHTVVNVNPHVMILWMTPTLQM